MANVYAIRNKVNAKLYIGSTINKVKTRFDAHKASLIAGKHHSKWLQRDWNHYGAGSFELVVIEKCKPEDCGVLEDYWIEHYNSTNVNDGYNVKPGSQRRQEMSERERIDCKNAVYTIDLEGLRRAIEARGEA